MTYEQKMALHKAASIISSLKPEKEDSLSVQYIERIDEEIHYFFKERLNDWQFDLWRNRYCD